MHVLTKDRDEKQLSQFYGWLYENERDEEEEQLVEEASQIQKLLGRRGSED